MKAFGCTVPGKEAGWMEKAVPAIGPYDALVKPIVIAPCSSDVHNAFEIGSPAFLNNRVLGHEALAEVVEVGAEVKDFKPGDKIVVPAVTPDWRQPSIQDTYHQHIKNPNDSFRYAFSLDGVFAEFFLVPDADMNAAHLPDGMPYEKAVMACDMMTTGFHGAELAEIGFGESVAVIGIGPVGLMAVAGAVLRGAGRVMVVGTRQNCINIAREYGATDVISYKEGDIAKQIKAMTDRKGVDKVIIAGGNADTFAAAVTMVRPGGIVANINFYTGVPSLPIPLLAWGSGLSHKTLRGGLCPGGRRRMEKMLAMIQNGRVDPSRLSTHTFRGLAEVEPAFQMMVKKPGDLIKPIVYIQ